MDQGLLFEIGRTYRRRDLHATHGGQRQGGISTPKARSFLLLFTGRGEPYGYEDGWDTNGVFLYSGEGQKGEMTFTGGNRAIRDHARDGKDLHLFEQVGKGRVRYVGNFACVSWEYRDGVDKAHQPRRAIIFHLVPQSDVESKAAAIVTEMLATAEGEPIERLR